MIVVDESVFLLEMLMQLLSDNGVRSQLFSTERIVIRPLVLSTVVSEVRWS